MKTIEIVNGRKVWAVDSDISNGCLGCIYSNCGMPKYMKCTPTYREDKRSIIYQERTFTLSQINEVIDEIIIKGGNIPWNASLRILQSKLEQL